MNFKPSFFLISYFILGFLLALFGPIEYENIYSRSLVIFFISFIILFWLGFKIGSSGYQKNLNISKPPKIYTIVLIFSLSYSLFRIITVLMDQGLSAISFEAGASRYASGYEDYERNSGNYSLSWIISEIMYPIHLLTMVWSIYFFKKLKKIQKFLAALSLFLILLNFGILAGKMKIIGDIMISFSFILLALYYGQKISFFQKNILILGGFLGVALLVMTLANRYDNANIDIYNINKKAIDLQYYDENSALISLLGPKIGFGAMQFTGYLSNGYYGLSLAMKMPFEWTYFIGNSYSMMVIHNRFLGGEFLLEHTYVARTEEAFEWGMSKWHTAFTWYASDLTFPGTLLFFGLVAFLYGRIWRAVALDKNGYAIPIYVYLSIGFIFVPANNQLLISPGGIFTLILFFIIWLWPDKHLIQKGHKKGVLGSKK